MLLPPSNHLIHVPSEDIKIDHYYAVDYVNKFYIGRALRHDGQNFTQFKFLHSTGAAKEFNWPKTDDVERVHSSCIFYGPVSLRGNAPFTIAELEELEAVFRSVCKQKRSKQKKKK